MNTFDYHESLDLLLIDKDIFNHFLNHVGHYSCIG
jgi:hypothetical protein